MSAFAHLECAAKLVAHDTVQQGIDAGGQEEGDARDVGQDDVDLVERLTLGPIVLIRSVHRDQSLGMERGPAQEESHHHGN